MHYSPARLSHFTLLPMEAHEWCRQFHLGPGRHFRSGRCCGAITTEAWSATVCGSTLYQVRNPAIRGRRVGIQIQDEKDKRGRQTDKAGRPEWDWRDFTNSHGRKVSTKLKTLLDMGGIASKRGFRERIPVKDIAYFDRPQTLG